MLDKAYKEKLDKWAEENKDRVYWSDPDIWINDSIYTNEELWDIHDEISATYRIGIDPDWKYLCISYYDPITEELHNGEFDKIAAHRFGQYDSPDSYLKKLYEAKDLSDLSREVAKLVAKSGYFTPFPIYNENDKLSDFIYKVDETKTLKVATNYSSIQEYFEAEYEDHDDLNIIAIGIEEPIITMHKVKRNDELCYSFHVDIVSDSGDSFITHTTFKTSDEFRNLLIKTIDYIKDFKGFEKYIEDLQNCL